MDMSFMENSWCRARCRRCLKPHFRQRCRWRAGVITYTQWMNEAGTLEADLTVSKLSNDRYLVVVTDTMVRHAETWMKRNIPDGALASVTEVTAAYGQLNVQGPIHARCCRSLRPWISRTQHSRFRTAREIDIGFARVLCIRITYVGELGYELYIPAEQADACLRPHRRGGTRVRTRTRRPHGALKSAHGKGLPRLRPRPRHTDGPYEPASVSRSISRNRAVSSAGP